MDYDVVTLAGMILRYSQRLEEPWQAFVSDMKLRLDQAQENCGALSIMTQGRSLVVAGEATRAVKFSSLFRPRVNGKVRDLNNDTRSYEGTC
jgi:hypothetical protein